MVALPARAWPAQRGALRQHGRQRGFMNLLRCCGKRSSDGAPAEPASGLVMRLTFARRGCQGRAGWGLRSGSFQEGANSAQRQPSRRAGRPARCFGRWPAKLLMLSGRLLWRLRLKRLRQ